MAQKYWRKAPKKSEWIRTSDRKRRIELWGHGGSNDFSVADVNRRTNKMVAEKRFKTKAEAIQYAKRYMKKN